MTYTQREMDCFFSGLEHAAKICETKTRDHAAHIRRAKTNDELRALAKGYKIERPKDETPIWGQVFLCACLAIGLMAIFYTSLPEEPKTYKTSALPVVEAPVRMVLK